LTDSSGWRSVDPSARAIGAVDREGADLDRRDDAFTVMKLVLRSGKFALGEERRAGSRCWRSRADGERPVRQQARRDPSRPRLPPKSL
jgi:hypothetical protein